MFAVQVREPGRAEPSSSSSSQTSAAVGSQAQLDAQLAAQVCGTGAGYSQTHSQSYRQDSTKHQGPSRQDYIPEHWTQLEQRQWGPRMRGPCPSPSFGSGVDNFVRPTSRSAVTNVNVSMPPPSAFAVVDHQAGQQRNTASPIIVS